MRDYPATQGPLLRPKLRALCCQDNLWGPVKAGHQVGGGFHLQNRTGCHCMGPIQRPIQCILGGNESFCLSRVQLKLTIGGWNRRFSIIYLKVVSSQVFPLFVFVIEYGPKWDAPISFSSQELADLVDLVTPSNHLFCSDPMVKTFCWEILSLYKTVYYLILNIISYYIILYYIILYRDYILSDYILLEYIILYYIILYCSILWYIILCYFVLYYHILSYYIIL